MTRHLGLGVVVVVAVLGCAAKDNKMNSNGTDTPLGGTGES